MALLRHQQPRGQRAALAGVGDHAERGEQRRGVEVGVVKHDRRGLAAELEEDLLECVAGGRHDPPAGRRGAGEGDHVDVGAGGQCRPDLWVGSAEHVDDAGGNVGVVGDQLTKRQRDERGVRRGLENHRASGGQRGRELGQCELIRIVVGDDRRHHPAGLFLHPAVVLHTAALDVSEVFGHRIGLQQFGVVAHDLDRRVELSALAQRFGGADFRDGERGKLVAVFDQRAMELFEATDPQFGVRRTSRSSSKARRAAAIAASASATVASGAWPSTSPVAGLREGNVRSVSSSRPSINRRRSAWGSAMSAAASLEMVGDSCIILLSAESVSVMETSFSSSANHTFAEGELKQMARTPAACD